VKSEEVLSNARAASGLVEEERIDYGLVDCAEVNHRECAESALRAANFQHFNGCHNVS
jgi:hypothetical protein